MGEPSNQPLETKKYIYCDQNPLRVWQEEGFDKFLQLLRHGKEKFWLSLVVLVVSIIALIGGMVLFGVWAYNTPTGSNGFYGGMIFSSLALGVVGAVIIFMTYTQMLYRRVDKMTSESCINSVKLPTDQGEYANLEYEQKVGVWD